MRKNELMAALIFGGSNAEVEPVTITQNGVTQVPEGKAYNPITVNVRNTPSDKLYYQGDECVAATGGWEQLGSTGTITKNDDYIRMRSPEGKTSYVTTHNKILFDRIDQINVKASRSSNSCFEIDLCLFSAKDLSTSPAYTLEVFPYNGGATTPTVVNIDTSAITGEYYVAIKARNGSLMSGNNCDLFEVTAVPSIDKLYYLGDECELATGGWEKLGTDGTLTKNADYINFATTNRCTIITQKKVALDNVSGIKVKLAVSGYYTSMAVCLYLANDATLNPAYTISIANQSPTTPGERTADTSAITGEYYIAIRLNSSNGNRSGQVYEVTTVAAS